MEKREIFYLKIINSHSKNIHGNHTWPWKQRKRKANQIRRLISVNGSRYHSLSCVIISHVIENRKQKGILAIVRWFSGEAKLNGKHDIVRHDLKPSDQYKSVSNREGNKKYRSTRMRTCKAEPTCDICDNLKRSYFILIKSTNHCSRNLLTLHKWTKYAVLHALKVILSF